MKNRTKTSKCVG